MRVEGKIVDALVMTKKKVESSKEPGTFFHSIGIVKDEELGELNCTAEVYDTVEKMNIYDFGFRYNTQYKSLQVDQVLCGYGTLAQQAANKAVAEQIAAAPAEEKLEVAAVPESEPAEEEKKEEASATNTSKSKK